MRTRRSILAAFSAMSWGTSQALGYASTIAVLLMFIMLILSVGLLFFTNPLRERENF